MLEEVRRRAQARARDSRAIEQLEDRVGGLVGEAELQDSRELVIVQDTLVGFVDQPVQQRAVGGVPDVKRASSQF